MEKKIILFIFIGIIVGSVIGIKAATTIKSNQVIYKDDKMLDMALNEIYDELYVGKNKIAEAITNKGIETNSDNTLEEMANNIDNITIGDGKKWILNGSVGHENISLGFKVAANYTVSQFYESTSGYYARLEGGAGQCGIYIKDPIDLSKYKKIVMIGNHQGVPVTLEYDCSNDTDIAYIGFGGNCGNGFHRLGIYKKTDSPTGNNWAESLVEDNHSDWGTNSIYGGFNIVGVNAIWLE